MDPLDDERRPESGWRDPWGTWVGEIMARPEIGLGERMTLIAILKLSRSADRLPDADTCRVTYPLRKIARFVGRSANQVQRYTSRLKHMGLLECELERWKGGTRPVWTVHLDRIREHPPVDLRSRPASDHVVSPPGARAGGCTSTNGVTPRPASEGTPPPGCGATGYPGNGVPRKSGPREPHSKEESSRERYAVAAAACSPKSSSLIEDDARALGAAEHLLSMVRPEAPHLRAAESARLRTLANDHGAERVIWALGRAGDFAPNIRNANAPFSYVQAILEGDRDGVTREDVNDAARERYRTEVETAAAEHGGAPSQPRTEMDEEMIPF